MIGSVARRALRIRSAAVPCSLCVVALLSSGGCRGDAPPGPDVVQRYDSAGIEIVVNPGEDRFLDWSFEEVFVLGDADEGPEAFGRVASTVGVDTDGNIYVLDVQRLEVASFDSTGAHRWSAGRRGSGPGEFLSPSRIAVSPEGVIEVQDIVRGRFVRFDAAGSLLDEEPFDGLSLAHRGITFALSGPRWARLFSPEPPQPMVVGSTHQEIVGFGEQRLPTLEGTRVIRPYAKICGENYSIDGYEPNVRFGAGYGLLVGKGSWPEYRFDLYDVGDPGDPPQLRRSVRRRIAPVPSGVEDLRDQFLGARLRDGTASCEGATAAGEPNGTPAYRESYWSFVIGPDMSIWALRIARTEHEGPSLYPPLVDVFDSNGIYRGTLPLGTQLPRVFFPDGRAVFRESDDLGRSLLVVRRIVRSPPPR